MKRKLFVLFVLFFIGTNVYGWWVTDKLISHGDLSVLDEVISWSELGFLSQSDRRIVRNSIFARYGRSFASEDLQRHFNQFAWYNPIHSNVDRFLTAIDNENIRRIQEIETHGTVINAYHNRILSWIQSERIIASNSTINFNEVRLFSNPVLHPRSPENIMEHPMTVISCTSIGRFLLPAESNVIIQALNINELREKTGIHIDFFFSRDNGWIIFNPNILFWNLGSKGQEEKAYLFIISDPSILPQLTLDNLKKEGISNNILFLGGSLEVLIISITSDGIIEFVNMLVAG